MNSFPWNVFALGSFINAHIPDAHGKRTACGASLKQEHTAVSESTTYA